MIDDIEGHKSLIAEVVNQALKDSMIPPYKSRYGLQASKHALTAMQFLYSDDVNAWLEWLDIDGEVFKSRLDKIMFKDSNANFVAGPHSPLDVDDFKRRIFRTNYKLWKKRIANNAMGFDLEDDYE